MAFESVKQRYMPRDNIFYRQHAHHVVYGVMALIGLLIIAMGVVLYQVIKRPLPVFKAATLTGPSMQLTPFLAPNLLPDTILRWASEAATLAYTFDFDHYKDQIALARPYFTQDGWNAYLASANDLIASITQNQLIVNGVVAGTPVISNQGPLPDKGYTWRMEIPFLVTYTSGSTSTQRAFYVVITAVQIPTTENPQGIGIDQFVMVSR